MSPNHPTLALPGVWCPWAQVLCFPCHGLKGPITTEALALTPREGIPETPTAWGESLCKCDQCGTAIWVHSDAGRLAALRDAIHASDAGPITGDLWQTGGMCPALGLSSTETLALVVVTCLDGPWMFGRYETPGDWEEGEYNELVELSEDTALDDVIAAAAKLLTGKD